MADGFRGLEGYSDGLETVSYCNVSFVCITVHDQWMGEHGGVIVNIIADMFRGFPIMAHTGAARSAVDNLTKVLRVSFTSLCVAIASDTIYSFDKLLIWQSPTVLYDLLTYSQILVSSWLLYPTSHTYHSFLWPVSVSGVGPGWRSY